MLEEMISEYEEQRKAMTEKFRGALTETFRGIFEKHPELAGFTWNQYTPYFNDGDPCEFSYNDYSFCYVTSDGKRENPDVRYCSKTGCPVQIVLKANGASSRDEDRAYKLVEKCEKCGDEAWLLCTMEDALEDRENATEVWKDPDGTDSLYTEMHGLNKILERSEDFLHEIFGDHVEVVVTRTGIETRDYQHD